MKIRSALFVLAILLSAAPAVAHDEPLARSKQDYVCLTPLPPPLLGTECATLVASVYDPVMHCIGVGASRACEVHGEIKLTVNGPATCGWASSELTPSQTLDGCTGTDVSNPGAIFKVIMPSEREMTPHGDIPAGGREEKFLNTVCVRPAGTQHGNVLEACKTFVITVWLPDQSASGSSLLDYATHLVGTWVEDVG